MVRISLLLVFVTEIIIPNYASKDYEKMSIDESFNPNLGGLFRVSVWGEGGVVKLPHV